MNVLVLTAFYPIPDKSYERMFVHVRDVYYSNNNIKVTVLNFDAKKDYNIDGIHVITESTYQHDPMPYELVISHSANLRNHYRFLKRYSDKFAKMIFFFHGHEMLRLTKDYPMPYSFLPTSKKYRRIFQAIYDSVKIKLWKRYYPQLAYKSYYIFVSNWLKTKFFYNTGLSSNDLLNHIMVINNCVGDIFENEKYNSECDHVYDFITIRSNLDGSKYCIDEVVELAKRYKNYKFLIIGNGKYFQYNKKPDNVTLIQKTMSHEEMIQFIDDSKCAMMPTREDTQGVMTCELATFGIPTITSDIDVCREMFDSFENVILVNQNELLSELPKYYKNIIEHRKSAFKNKKFYKENTTKKEVDLIKMLCSGGNFQ